MKLLRKILITFGNLFDIGWWANKINTKLGLYEKAKESRFRKWQDGLNWLEVLGLANSRLEFFS
jgi:hypothetical protein